MILAIDIGNTTVALGGIRDGRVCFVARMDTVRTRTAAEYRAEMDKIFAHRRHPERPMRFEGAVLTSVVPQITGALAECARIADGMAGIVCGTSFAAMLGLMGVMTLLGWFPLGVLPAALAGSLMAFLLWNFPPAKLRLGSVGSLFLAGMLGCVPLCIGWPDLALPLALPFWLEGGMVALQILVCKASRGRRQLFRSAPLHRWLELRGQSAEQIFYTFCVIAMLGVALTVQLAKIS